MAVFRSLGAAIGSAALASILAVAPAHGLANGQPVKDDDAQAKAVVSIRGCTATAIAEHWVLTARHCVIEGQGNFPVYIGTEAPNRRQAQGTEAKWAPAGDIVLIKVPEGLGMDSYATLPSEPIKRDEIAQIYGWGVGTGKVLATAQTKTGGTYHFPGTYNDGIMFSVRHLDKALSRPGDSGGPLFYNGAVAGVASAAASIDVPIANFAEVYSQKEWIEEQLATTALPRDLAQPEPETAPSAPAPAKPEPEAAPPAPAPSKPQEHFPHNRTSSAFTTLSSRLF
ncbi:hypothetical protein CPHO_03965 [Corynebacterium phocae]|uniref:Peptidase S1 domain-containing protein n=1 Tax=Corynebacterium phocae TaxID=161895 RepID=A0A1L7D2H3_9CORY|nr:trypsin-like serine protease [Corynebacterium phocae]APT92181.1 hypothetical protein CPHO_03965 [Corynebacterium phocae]KAA8725758.1 S1 family peptidase [Corynebacterium phocae]